MWLRGGRSWGFGLCGLDAFLERERFWDFGDIGTVRRRAVVSLGCCVFMRR